jgi:hypothetical protein
VNLVITGPERENGDDILKEYVTLFLYINQPIQMLSKILNAGLLDKCN